MTPQMQRLLTHLKSKAITPIEAWQTLGIYRLSDTVYKLRKLGYDIKTIQTKSFNRFEEVVRFATYELKGV